MILLLWRAAAAATGLIISPSQTGSAAAPPTFKPAVVCQLFSSNANVNMHSNLKCAQMVIESY